MVGGPLESIGDNKEFGVATAGEITIHFTNSSSLTSSDDSSSDKYFDRIMDVTMFDLRTNQTVQIVSMTGPSGEVTFTDPITVIVNAGHIEKWDTPVLTKMVIRTLTDDTDVKLRVK